LPTKWTFLSNASAINKLRVTRRRLLQNGGLAAAAALTPRKMLADSSALLDIASLAKFVDPLPVPPKAKPSGAHYRVVMRAFEAKMHRDMKPTQLWGYDGICPGPTFDVRSGSAITVEWVNELPGRHFLPIDHSLHGAEPDQPQVRTAVHLHGAKVGPESDGYPENWRTPGQSATHFYPNGQEAATLFYHDHAMAITRLNTAAGLMGLYLIRDEFEDSLHLPTGPFEIPLVLFDRSFREDGQIYYPVSGKPDAPWVSEYYGGGILVNGKLFPYLEVRPQKYRFRMLNSSNGSFYVLTLDPERPFWQIGSDQGLLAEPAPLGPVILGPGERADLIVDFSGESSQEVYLRTSVGPILQFRVSGNANKSAPLPAKLRPIERVSKNTAVKTRTLTLGDDQNRLGMSGMMLLNRSRWSDPVTEKPVLNSTEIWSFVNLTDDTHPIHLHLVRFQILDRRVFDVITYHLTGKVVYTEPARTPEPNEFGWKDTVRVDPATVTRIIAKFEGFAGRYVWHCHLLEHEDNEMMRPYEVVLETAP
jgi:spore coat protein A, manganese oxidase